MIKILASSLILALFLIGIILCESGSHTLLPSLRLLQETRWDFSLFWVLGSEKALALFLAIPAALGFLGWSWFFQRLFFSRLPKETARFLGFSLVIPAFSLYVFGLGINEILYGPLVFLFFIPALGRGWKEWGTLAWPGVGFWKNKRALLWILPFLLWLSEYLSSPIIWDAVLDHFRYAREVSRLHQIPMHWINHTGDMPKAAELLLAGFWSMGSESLSKLSSALAAIGAIWLLRLFLRESKGNGFALEWIFWTCPFFIAIFSWGYVEGFLALYELLALYCLWKTTTESGKMIWPLLAAFFLGFALSVKYTAFLAVAAIVVVGIYWSFVQKIKLKLHWKALVLLILPFSPWFLKNWMAYGNPLYPLATSVFGTAYGYGPGMEKDLWQDTGLPLGLGLLGRLGIFWKVFFTPDNAVAACWTPLVFMSLPWGWKALKRKLGIFLLLFAGVFFTAWVLLCTSLRHASGGALVLVLLSAMAWEEAFKNRRSGAGMIFGVGVLLSLWLCLSAQLNATAPYASALGLEDPLLRLKRNYSYDTDVYAAYQFIEANSDPKDKVMAFAVFQTYPLQRIAFVDFKWKRPIFLQWASQSGTAEQLARKLHEEGVRYFLYQQWEAKAMSNLEKDFDLEGMSAKEYERFWQLYMEPVKASENSVVYEARTVPLGKPRKLDLLPGLQEKGYWRPI